MRRFYLLLAVAVVVAAASCQNDAILDENLASKVDCGELSSPYAISKEEALDRLDDFMGVFDDCETRSHRRRVASINSVSMNDLYGHTRANQADDIENLLYIVEFENGEGSAILGADERLKPVYAVLDKSVLTIEDFNNATTSNPSEDISTFTAGLILDEVSRASLDLPDSIAIIPPGGGLHSHWDDYIKVHVRTKYIEPLLNTKWSQTSYYNDRFPNTESGARFGDGKQCAGCTTIALAQILNNNSYPSPIDVNNHRYYWRDINRHTWDASSNDIDSVDMDLLALFIFDLAQDLRVEYNDTGSTSAGVNDVKRVMRRLGYSDFSEGGITEDRIYPMLLNQRAVLTGGWRDGGIGHAWVIDGWKTVRTDHYRVTYNGNNIEISREFLSSTTDKYVHCNMGWSGDCDGYYPLDVFDVSYAKIGDNVELDCGDNPNSPRTTPEGDRIIYEYNLNSLTYSF